MVKEKQNDTRTPTPPSVAESNPYRLLSEAYNKRTFAETPKSTEKNNDGFCTGQGPVHRTTKPTGPSPRSPPARPERPAPPPLLGYPRTRGYPGPSRTPWRPGAARRASRQSPPGPAAPSPPPCRRRRSAATAGRPPSWRRAPPPAGRAAHAPGLRAAPQRLPTQTSAPVQGHSD